MTASIKPLEVACPTCHVPAGRRCVTPSRRQVRLPHDERRRARFGGEPEVMAVIAEFDWRRHLHVAAHRLLDQEGDAESEIADATRAGVPA